MMSEKRFHQFGLWVIDNPNFNGISIADLVDTELMPITEVVELLNEQQATIRKLQDLCGKSDYENAKLRLKNKELQEEIKLLKPTNVEQYEQIVQLQEELEQLKKVK